MKSSESKINHQTQEMQSFSVSQKVDIFKITINNLP